MNVVVFIDPGVHCCGFAMAVSGQLVDGGLVHFDSLYAIHEYVASKSPNRVVCEVPQAYDLQHQKGDQNDLIRLALVAGAVCSAASQSNQIKPRSWKGTMPKDKHQRERIVPALEKRYPRILEAVQSLPKMTRHNAIDACGLALWWMDNHKDEG